MPDLNLILERMGSARAALLSAADRVPSGRWQEQLAFGGWSTAELIAHLIQVECAITTKAAELVERHPMPVPVWRRLHLPLWMIESRLVRRKTPIPLEAGLVADKEETLARLREARRGTLGFIQEVSGRDLSPYRYPHPFVGSLNLYDWLRVIAHHEVRHTKQIREIVNSFHE